MNWNNERPIEYGRSAHFIYNEVMEQLNDPNFIKFYGWTRKTWESEFLEGAKTSNSHTVAIWRKKETK